MQRTKKRNKAALVLPVLLVGSGILVACIGLSLKAKLKEDGRYGEQMAVAVPFLMMQERDSLKPLQSPITEPSSPSQPPESTPPAVQTEPTEPSEEATEATAPPPVYGEDESWFDDALFIGDSRMVGLSMYARLGQADYFAGVGLSVFQLFSQTASDTDFGETDLTSLLTSRSYGKIFSMLGLNEAGYPLDSLKERYRQDVEQIQELQPDAVIYLLQIYGVSKEKSDAVHYLKPDHLDQINQDIRELCDGEQVRCLDPRPLYEDKNGYLLPDYSGDGVHPYGKYDALLAQWLCQQVA